MNSLLSSTPYEQTFTFADIVGGQAIKIISKPGIPNWNKISPSSRLLAEHVELLPPARLLLLGCGHGAAAVALARNNPDGELWLTDPSTIALKLASKTLQANQISGAIIIQGVSVLPEKAAYFDAVVIDLPKGRKLSQRWLAEAYGSLRTGGQLFLAGANGQGIRTIIKDAEWLFGSGTILAYKKGNRIARLTKPSASLPPPPWLQAPGVSPGTWIEFEAPLPSGRYRLRSLPGVFSSDRLDDGTRILLQTLHIPPGARVLDLGCGYGAIGLHASLSGAAHVDMIDASLLAVAAAQENIRLYKLSNAQAFTSDALEAVLDRHYSTIVTNPPFHSGKAVDYQMTQAFIQQSQQVLEPGGQLWLVANKFIHYERVLEPVFQRVERVFESNRYHVLLATN